MSDQPDLFGTDSPPPHNRTATSKLAALSMTGKSGAQRWRVFCAIRDAEAGLTREEIMDLLGIGGDSARPRVWELMGNPRVAGVPSRPALVYENGEQRMTKSGRMAAVVVVAEQYKNLGREWV